jgi:hypothetical protein
MSTFTSGDFKSQSYVNPLQKVTIKRPPTAPENNKPNSNSSIFSFNG